MRTFFCNSATGRTPGNLRVGDIAVLVGVKDKTVDEAVGVGESDAEPHPAPNTTSPIKQETNAKEEARIVFKG